MRCTTFKISISIGTPDVPSAQIDPDSLAQVKKKTEIQIVYFQ
jgi:hypothetical protein